MCSRGHLEITLGVRDGEPAPDIHADCRRRIEALEVEIEALEGESAESKRQNRSLLKRVEALEARLKQNSRNSSKPPSSDPPWTPSEASEAPSDRKRGGQPGHPGSQRKLVPPDQVDQIVEVKPTCCGRCGKRLGAKDRQPRRHQVWELPEADPQVTEFRLHTLACDDCGLETTAAFPTGVSGSCFGPRLEATVAYLSGRAHLSKRAIQELLWELYEIPISLGAISAIEQRVSAALETPYREVQRHVQREPMAHADETGFRESNRRAWVWVAVTMTAVLFVIHLRRNGRAARELLGKFKGILVTDRWKAYEAWSVWQRQLCWAHLRRDFRAFLEYRGTSARIGRALLEETDQMFRWWYRVRDGTLKFSSFQKYMGPVRQRIEELLEQGARCRQAKTAGSCREMLKLSPAMWTFVSIEGIEPTNNLAEQQIRQVVLYRKISFGTQGPRGSRFVERIMTTVATLRYQGRHVLGYLHQVCRATNLGKPAPPLLSRRIPQAVAAA